MISFYKHELDTDTQNLRESTRDQMYPSKSMESIRKRAIVAEGRYANWTRENMYDNETVDTYNKGLVVLNHPSLHDHRAREKSKELGDMAVYLRRYKTAQERAKDAEKEFKDGHLPTVPFAYRRGLERERVEKKEIGPPMQYGIRTENERILSSIERSPVDLSKANNKMVFYPSWKDDRRDKWINPEKNFDNAVCTYQGKKSVDPWLSTQLTISTGDPYKGGFEEIGDLGRSRIKSLEVSPERFCSTVTNAGYKNLSEFNSNSIQTLRTIDFINKKKNILTRSSKSYPKSLSLAVSDSIVKDDIRAVDAITDSQKERKDSFHEPKVLPPRSLILMEIPSMTNFGTPRSEGNKTVSSKFGTSDKFKMSRFGNIGRTITNSKFSKHLHPINQEEAIKYKIGRYFDQ